MLWARREGQLCSIWRCIWLSQCPGLLNDRKFSSLVRPDPTWSEGRRARKSVAL